MQLSTGVNILLCPEVEVSLSDVLSARSVGAVSAEHACLHVNADKQKPFFRASLSRYLLVILC